MTRHIYVHVPFCTRRCLYCDFSIAVRRTVPVDEYLSALAAEIKLRFGDSRVQEVDTIYFGGGTPSRLGGEGLARALEIVQRRFPAATNAEITAEANPEDISRDVVSRWRDAGINRLSLGAQSFDDRTLAWMHRTHDAGAIDAAVETCRAAGLDNLSLDLIFSLPDALERDLDFDLRRVLKLEPEHISLYGLTVESTTGLGKAVQRGGVIERPDEGYEEDYRIAHSRLTAAGYEHYEVSNYAKPGHRARHNSAYWAGVPYVGLGPSAHEYDGEVRRWNARAYADWCARLASGRDPMQGSERLTAANRIAEDVYLGLRSDTGLAAELSDEPLITRWLDAGWLVQGTDGRIRCTMDGWLRLDAIAAALTHHRSR